MAIRHRVRLKEVPVTMREREHGRSSISALGSVYYMVKILLALFVGLFRRRRWTTDATGGAHDTAQGLDRRDDRVAAAAVRSSSS